MLDIPDLIALIRDAILNRRQLVFTAKGRRRELCPHMLGTRQGIWHVYGWQFGGETEEGTIPDWRCLELRAITSEIVVRDGEWHRGRRPKRARQSCVDFIYAEVRPEQGQLPPSTSVPTSPLSSADLQKKR